MHPYAVALLVCLMASPAMAWPVLTTGRAGPVLLDGRCEAGEWSGAERHRITDAITVMLQRDDRFLYLCVLSPTESMNTLDIYLQAADRPDLVNLHASAQVGHRVRTPEGWPEYEWWNHAGWYSPAVPFTGMQQEGGRTRAQFKSGVPREVQIDLARFGALPWRVMLVIGGERDAEGDWVNRRFPEAADENSPAGWATLAAG